MFSKEKLIDSITAKIEYLKNERTAEADARAEELKQLLYVINKGCFEVEA